MIKKIKLILPLCFVIIMFSCRTEENTIAEIIVKDEKGASVSGALVRLYGEQVEPTNPSSTTIIRNDSCVTNASGIAVFDYTEEFNLGQVGFAVLNISVNKSGKTGVGIVKIEPEKTIKEIIYIK